MTTILLGVVGSRAYGLSHGGSDTDYLGIFQRPTREILGRMNKGEISADSRVSKEPDTQLHEVGKFFRLVSESNPGALELLWLPDESYVITTLHGGLLTSHREVFLSQRARGRYIGYARGQVKKLVAGSSVGNDIEKFGRHAARLLIQLQVLLETGQLEVRLSEEGVEVAREMGRLATTDATKFTYAIEQMIVKADSTETDLPKDPDMNVIRDLLVELRLMELASGDAAAS
jgi:predicted nucleotidyltransferase